MLSKLRKKKTAKKIWIFLALIIVPAFVLWGAGSMTRSNKEEPLYVGKIFNKKVSAEEYKQSRDAIRVQMIMQLGENYAQLEKFLNLDAQAMDRLILLYEAKQRKISVGDRDVINAVANNPYFWRRGRFDNKIYNETLRYVFGVQARAFEELTRQSLILAKLYKEITQGIKLNEAELQNAYQKANEEITLAYLAAMADEFSKDIQPSDEEIINYYANKSLDFKQPLSFNLEYIASESEEKIKQVVLGLDKKTQLEKLLKEQALTIKETGLFTLQDPIPGIGWSMEVLSLLPKLKPGEFSSIFKIDKNYYLLRLKEKKEGYIPELEKIKDKVRAALIKEKALELASSKAESALKQAKEGGDWGKIAQESGLKNETTKPFKFGSYIEGIGASDDFWNAAQNLKEGEINSGIVKTPAGFFLIKLQSRTSFDPQKYAQEKEEFAKKLLEQKQEEFFSKFLEELRKKS